MTTPPIGVATRPFRLPLRAALAAAAEAGAEFVEIDARNELRIADFTGTALRQFRKVLEDLRLRVASIAFPTRRGYDDPDDLERRVMATREAMTFAYGVGARVVVGRPGELAEPTTDEAAPVNATMRDALDLLAVHGEHCGARFAIATGASPTAQRGLLDALPDGGVGVALQPALLIGEGHGAEQAAAELGPDVACVYAADAVRDSSSAGRATEVELGRGEADLPAVLARLEEHAYLGPIIARCGAAADPRGELANAVAYLRTLMAER
ncbi:MAG: TIM barrel protein [Planctomycetota bacterium]